MRARSEATFKHTWLGKNMRLRTGIAGLAVLASLLVLLALVSKTQQRELTASDVTEQLLALSGADQALAQIDAELNRIRVEQDTNFTLLNSADERWQDANGNLAVSLGATSMGVALRGYFDDAEHARKLLQNFRVQQNDFVSSFNAFRSQVESSLKQMVLAGADEQVQQLVPRLVEELARYSLQSRPDNAETIEVLAARVPADFAALPEAAKVLQARKDALQATLNAWSQLELAEALETADSRQRDELALQERSLNTYTIALAAYAGALLLVFGLIGLRLQKSLTELDAINTDLEKVVQKRTADLHKALNELRMQQAHLVQSEKMASLGQMVAGVAHEINTPLGYATSNVETIRESLGIVSDAGGLSEDAAERMEEADVLLEDAMHGLGQIDELVKSLKNFSRVDRSHTELFDLNQGLDTALKICQSNLKGRIEVEKDYAAGLPELLCAPSQLNQVFLNLINNGAQAIDGPGSIRLATRQVGDRIEVRIRDSGCGMDEETRAHIFEPFFTTKPVGEGTGLGLSIVFRIVEDHGGTIDVNSAPGEGTEFVISLPVRKAAEAAPAAAQQTAVILDEPEEVLNA